MIQNRFAPAAEAVTRVIQLRDNLLYLIRIATNCLLYNIHIVLHPLQSYAFCSSPASISAIFYSSLRFQALMTGMNTRAADIRRVTTVGPSMRLALVSTM